MPRMVDERVLAGKREINSKAFSLCFIALWLIVFYRGLFLQQSIQEYLDIFLLTLGISFYVTVNLILQGYYGISQKRNKDKVFIFVGALTGTIAFITVQIVMVGYDLTDSNDLFRLSLSALIFFLVWSASQLFMLMLSKRRSEKDLE